MARLPTRREMSIGRVLSRAFATIAGAPVSTLGTACLCALPGVLFGLVPGVPEWEAAPALVGGLVSVLLWMVAQGALIRATAIHDTVGQARIGECAAAGLRTALPLLALAIVASIGVVIGWSLLLVPGVMLLTLWSVAAPAVVEERYGVLGALERSRALTKGARWRVFALFLVVIVLWWIVSALVGVGLIVGGGFRYAGQDGAAALPFLALSLAVKTITTACWGTIQGSLYLELRDWKDGPATEALAEVFA